MLHCSNCSLYNFSGIKKERNPIIVSNDQHQVVTLVLFSEHLLLFRWDWYLIEMEEIMLLQFLMCSYCNALRLSEIKIILEWNTLNKLCLINFNSLFFILMWLINHLTLGSNCR